MARWNAKLGPARLAQQCFCRYRTAPCGEARGGTREQAFDDAAIPSGMGGISAVLSRRGTRTPLGALLLPMRITVSWFGSLRPANTRTLAAPSRHRVGDSRWPWKHKRRASVKFYDRDYLDVSNPSIAASWPAYWPKMRGTGKRYDQEMGGNHDHRF